MPNTQIENHPLIGATVVSRPMDEPYDREADTEGGTLIVGNGMKAEVKAVFENWNGVEGLSVVYVFVPETGYHTHLSDREAGFTMLTKEAS